MNKDKLIEEFLKEPIKVGDTVYIDNKSSSITVVEIDDQYVYYHQYGYFYLSKVEKDKVRKSTHNVGYNPFDLKSRNRVRIINFTLEGILVKMDLLPDFDKSKYPNKNGFNIPAFNDNPFVIINDEKKYYQRPLVWTLVQKQSLIHSIYNNISCGKIIVRPRTFDWNNNQEDPNDLSFYDIVDGKQRLNAIAEFISNKFPDMNGVYYKEFSTRAQRMFLDHQLFSYGEMDEDASDEDVLEEFLAINFTGVPQSIEHIKYVESLLNEKL